MGSNAAMVGRSYTGELTAVDRQLCEAYASATSDANPRYRGESAVAPPMVAVVASIPQGVKLPLMDREFFGDPARLLRLLHGEEDIRWHRLMRAGDTLTTVGTILGVVEKSSGELVTVGTRLVNQRGELVAETRSSLLIRDNTKKPGSIKELKEELSRGATPDAGRAVRVSWTVAPDQSTRYADVSLDKNPIHLDDAVARAAGLRGRVLHGLCTMAFAQRAVIDELAGGDPARLARLKVRFTKPVHMGDTLTCEAWSLEESADVRTYGLVVLNQDGALVLRDAVAEVRRA